MKTVKFSMCKFHKNFHCIPVKNFSTETYILQFFNLLHLLWDKNFDFCTCKNNSYTGKFSLYSCKNNSYTGKSCKNNSYTKISVRIILILKISVRIILTPVCGETFVEKSLWRSFWGEKLIGDKTKWIIFDIGIFYIILYI